MVHTWDYFHRRQAWGKFVLTSFLEMQSVNAGSVHRQPDSYIPKVEELQKKYLFLFNLFYIRLLDYSIVLKARHYEINSWIDHFAFSWINSKVNGNHEILNIKPKRKIFLLHQVLNRSPLKPKASVLTISYADPCDNVKCFSQFGITK